MSQESKEVIAYLEKQKAEIERLRIELEAERKKNHAIKSAVLEFSWGFRRDDESWNENFERIAERFHREMGVMAPGKSDPFSDFDEEKRKLRQEIWDRWNTERKKAFLSVLETQETTDLVPSSVREELEKVSQKLDAAMDKRDELQCALRQCVEALETCGSGVLSEDNTYQRWFNEESIELALTAAKEVLK